MECKHPRSEKLKRTSSLALGDAPAYASIGSTRGRGIGTRRAVSFFRAIFTRGSFATMSLRIKAVPRMMPGPSGAVAGLPSDGWSTSDEQGRRHDGVRAATETGILVLEHSP